MSKSVPITGSPSVDDLLRRGLELHQSGRVDEARGFYERVLERQAANPAANHLLGLVFLARGDAGQSAVHIGRAVAASPDNAQYLANLGVALNAALRHDEAVEALERAVRLKPDFAEAHSNLGMAYRELGRPADAVAAYRRAIGIRPHEAGFHYNLGNALGPDIIPAEAAYRGALRLRPGYAAATNALAGMLDEQGRQEEGLAVVDAALRHAPNDAQLQLRRSILLHHAGRLAEALHGYDRTIQLTPGSGEAHFNRALVRRHSRRDSAIDSMQALFEDQTADAAGRIFAGFGLGKALADIGEHAESVETFLAVNRLSRAQRPFSLERAKGEQAADLNRFTETAPADPSRPPGPIFVVGLPRAGKSTIEAILSGHPGAVPVRELPTLQRLYEALTRQYPGVPLAEVPRAALAELGAQYLAESRRFVGAGQVGVDTMPSNYRLAGVIAAALPDARIIWPHRDWVGHCITILEKALPGRGHEYANDPDDLVALHTSYREAMATWHARMPDRIHLLDVAELRRDRGARTRELLEFCGLSWNEACLADMQSEPQLDDWTAAERAVKEAGQRAAWAARRPDLFA